MFQLLALVLLAVVPDPAPARPEGLQARARIIGQQYCDEGAQLGSLRLDLNVALHNGGKRTLILPRQLGRASIERAARAHADEIQWRHVGWECGLVVDTEESMRRVPRVLVEAEPDLGQFLLLRPGQTHEIDLSTQLLIGPPGQAQYAPPEGEDFLVGVDVGLWPFRLDGENTVRELRKRWEASGVLLDGFVSTDPIRVKASAGPWPKCPAPPPD